MSPLRRAVGLLPQWRPCPHQRAGRHVRLSLGDKSIAFHHCKTCGCTTHLQAVAAPNKQIFGVNARLVIGLDPASPLRQIDNAHTGVFWTKSAQASLAGRHPKMDDPDDWFAPYR
jgi:hypothetical protein